MAKSHSHSSCLKIHSGNLAHEEVGALRRLLSLLASHLRYPWELVDDVASANLVIFNVDQPTPPPSQPPATAARMVGCALKPSIHAQASIHRPLRAYELLAVLSEINPRDQHQSHAVASAEPDVWRYKLRSWPLNFAEWPRDWQAVMAAITREYRSERELALCTGATPETVTACLSELSHLRVLERESAPRDLPRVESRELGRWHNLASRVGQLLGFRR
jgi:hypothetical protein